ncbi:MAG: hypothetical protein QJR05_05885 [Thermoanaerobacterium sp.]|nr:hypothetical protein [Thermoanaerobacterium sp.]
MAMDKKKLSQLKYLNKEIELLQKEIDKTKRAIDTYTATDVVKGSDSEWPYIRRTFRIEGVVIPDYERRVKHLQKKLQSRLDELIKKREEIEDFISKIPDSLIRQIITLRYKNGLTWNQIATHIGGNNTADSVRMMHNRFFNKK